MVALKERSGNAKCETKECGKEWSQSDEGEINIVRKGNVVPSKDGTNSERLEKIDAIYMRMKGRQA